MLLRSVEADGGVDGSFGVIKTGRGQHTDDDRDTFTGCELKGNAFGVVALGKTDGSGAAFGVFGGYGNIRVMTAADTIQTDGQSTGRGGPIGIVDTPGIILGGIGRNGAHIQLEGVHLVTDRIAHGRIEAHSVAAHIAHSNVHR